MRIVEITEFGLVGLRMGERPQPEPGPEQVLLRVGAVSLNYRDLLTVLGDYNPRQPLPLIPCSDCVGEIVAIGERVERFVVGDRVIPIFAQGWIGGRPNRDRLRSTLGGPLDGTLAESMVLDAAGLVRAPEGLTDEQAATLPCAALTAWNALYGDEPVRPGQTVLVLGTGGVSIFALQFAVLSGARVIVTSSRDDKLERARRMGAWQTVNYRHEPRWGKEIRRLTDGEGVDRVIEVGGAGTFAQSLDALAFGGRVSLIGNLCGGAAELDLIPLLMRQVRVQGIFVGNREDFEAMNQAVEGNRLEPVVDRVFPFEHAREALEYMREGRHFGKIVIQVRDREAESDSVGRC